MATAAALTALMLGTSACSGLGEEGPFPSDSINIVVPYSPGGSADQTARLLAKEAQKTCGTDVVVRNREGSAGAVGFQATANAKPDGYTVGVAAIELAILEHLGTAQVSTEDVRGVMQYSLQPIAYGVPKDSPLKTMDDVIKAAKNGGVSVATSGTGSIYHIGFAGMAQKAGVSKGMTNVPFDGAATALQAALGKQTDMVTVGAGELRPYVESGQLRALAIAGDQRQPDVLPGVPTLKEQGINWTSGAILGLVVPKETPDARVQKLNSCFNKARQSEEFVNFMKTQGFTRKYRDAAEFDAYMKEQYKRYGKLVDSLGIGAGSN
ncbi:tripartite tricarboxylate transporter substrate binding protein [Haloactinomyces albus]|uniref:Tripartite-type tricarboxylate transporter receptor subunit TctC n=1 Tax=Haloactinomyces albus TaxID=1352928 RepID=A0AAE3ZGC8_9ACTN|nr:tripartite tricarboxylate transporter substrate binding protein [Haloactinomyces albus]MDR7304413.1 tripartite-type tricarboxylate transporter receptor subunit TctC [Haloactinomyces albus]